MSIGEIVLCAILLVMEIYAYYLLIGINEQNLLKPGFISLTRNKMLHELRKNKPSFKSDIKNIVSAVFKVTISLFFGWRTLAIMFLVDGLVQSFIAPVITKRVLDKV